MTTTRAELERLLAATGWSLYELAKQAEVSYMSVHKWAHGKDLYTETADKLRAAMVEELERRRKH